MTIAPAREDVTLRGGNRDAYNALDTEILDEGPARTGKTYAYLLRLVNHAQNHAGYKGLIVRKVAATLGNTVLRTLEEDVFSGWDKGSRSSAVDKVHFFGGSTNEPAAYLFDNGSSINVGGMDSPSKILGAEYDEVFANEVVEFQVEDVETLISRLSHDVLGSNHLLMDCNPTYERHWVLQRALSGQMRHFKSTLRDNPAFYNLDGTTTQRGQRYLESIQGLTGTRYQRLVLGQWVGMENAIYPQMDRTKHLRPIPENTQWTGRAATGVDYGESRGHPSTVVTITQATTGVWWVRAAWAEDGGNTEHIEAAVAAHRLRFKSKLVRTDPTIRALANNRGWAAAQTGAGSRKARIGLVTELLDAGAFCIDEDGEGAQELFDEMVMYRYEIKETDTLIEDVVVRKDEDRVAGVEYAVEQARLAVSPPTSVPTRRTFTQSAPVSVGRMR